MTTNLAQLTTLGNLITVLQAHTLSATADINWGDTTSDTRLQVTEHLRALETAGLPNFVPAPFESLRRFVGGEDVPLAELAAAKTQLEYVSEFLKSLNAGSNGSNGSNGGNGSSDSRLRRMTASMRHASAFPQQVQLADQLISQNGPASDRRMPRMTGPVSASIIPASLRSERPDAPVVYPTRGENREITVTFVDVVGFSPLGEELSHDEVFPVLNDILERLEEAVESEGGEVPGNWGDALLGIYGLRRGENHARSAIRAAVKMEKVLEDWNAHIRHPNVRELRIRSGTHTGEAAVGYLGGKKRKVRTAIGRTVNIGARLEPLAVFEISESKKEYGILVSDATLRSAGLRVFVHEPVGLKKLKGIAEERETFRILREAPPSLVPRGADQTSFIGRSRELSSLRRAFDETQTQNRAKLMVVKAEAGEGKSRLGDRFIEGLGKEAALIITQGENRETVFPYEGIASAIRAYAGIDPGDDVEQARNKVKYITQAATTGDQDAAQDLERRLPFLWKLLNIADSNGKQQRDFEEKESEIWEQVLQSVESLFLYLTRHRPLVLVLEDFHWMDPGSVGVIDRLLRKLHDRPFFCLALSRPPFVGDYLGRKIDEILPLGATEEDQASRDVAIFGLVEHFQDIPIQGQHSEDRLRKKIDEILPQSVTDVEQAIREESISQILEVFRRLQVISLEPLTADQLQKMVVEILPDAPEKVVLQLTELSGGNPYLITEMASEIKRGMSIEKDETTKTWHFTSSTRGVTKTVPLPSGALGFMQAKIDLLEPGQQEVLRLAAVVGAEFSIKDLLGLAREITPNDSARLLLSEGVAETLINHAAATLDMLVESKVLLPVEQESGKYQFPHALLRETAYEQIWKNARAEIHLAMARHLKSSRPTELAAIASHLANGGLREDAAQYYYDASEKGAQADPEGSIEYYRKGYEQATEPRLKLRLLRGWDEALYTSGRCEDQEKIYQLSLPLLDLLPPIDRAGTHYRRSRAYNKLFKFDEAIVELQETLKIISELTPQSPSEKTEMLKLKASALLQIGLTYGEIGRADDALRVYKEGYEAAAEARDFLNMGRGSWGLVDGSNKIGRYAGILERCQTAYESLLKIKDRRRVVGLLAEWSRSYLQLGDFKNAESTLRKAQEIIGGLQGAALSVGEVGPLMGRALTLQGRNAEAISLLQSFQNPNKSNYLLKLVYLAFAYLSDNQLQAASEEAKQAVELAIETKNSSMQAAAGMVLAQVFMREGKTLEAFAASQSSFDLVSKGKVTADLDAEILLTHVQILDALGHSKDALAVIQKAKDIIVERWNTIDAEKDRVSFLGQIKGNRDIVKLWQILRVSDTLEPRKRAEMRGYLDQLDFYTSVSVPNGLQEIVSKALEQPGEVATDDNHEITHHSRSHEPAEVGAVFIKSTLASVFDFLSSSKIELDVNPGELEEFQAEEIEFKLLRDRDKSLWALADWKIGSPMLKGKVALALSRRGSKMRELLEGEAISKDGSVVIELKRSARSSFISLGGEAIGFEKKVMRPKADEFGTLRFSFIPKGVEEVGIVMEMGKALYSRNVGNFLRAFLTSYRRYRSR